MCAKSLTADGRVNIGVSSASSRRDAQRSASRSTLSRNRPSSKCSCASRGSRPARPPDTRADHVVAQLWQRGSTHAIQDARAASEQPGVQADSSLSRPPPRPPRSAVVGSPLWRRLAHFSDYMAYLLGLPFFHRSQRQTGKRAYSADITASATARIVGHIASSEHAPPATYLTVKRCCAWPGTDAKPEVRQGLAPGAPSLLRRPDGPRWPETG